MTYTSYFQAQGILDRLYITGFSVWINGDTLRVKPTPDLDIIETLRQHKVSIISYLTHAGHSFMGGVSEQGKAPEIVTTGTTERTAEEQDELRDERAAIMEHDGGLSRDEAEARAARAYPCRCFGVKFWVSTYGAIRCGGCHPPASPGLVCRWIELCT